MRVEQVRQPTPKSTAAQDARSETRFRPTALPFLTHGERRHQPSQELKPQLPSKQPLQGQHQLTAGPRIHERHKPCED